MPDVKRLICASWCKI